uniref:UDP-N-acetylmuramoyl-tripeptide--D-alanyl-D- alanine ligase n=1 Tax=Ndongobacter massiliensis TaxID=1871025 RepID=UPI000931C150|nr:UDP-N-acetylmuramoyl-tripeptide--D-alanyl-D-alanine ligase [Ndongobacter massiliensis]
MKNQTIGSIAAFAGAALQTPQDAAQPIHEISTDSRTIHAGDVYLPLLGARLDGHQFIEEAFSKGAVATFCDREHELPQDHCTLLVDDTMEAFQQLAKNYRAALDVKIIGITGSNGKTTTKDIVNSVLRERYRTKKTVGNFNNQIGVPRTLLDLDEDTEIGVVEMGMDHFHEISKLVELARPDFTIITNVGDSHLLELGTKENVAQAKLEILEQQDENGYFLYNYDDMVLRKAVCEREIRPKVLTYGTDPGADYRIVITRSNAAGTSFSVNGTPWHINLIGSYQAYNATVAVIIGQLLGLSAGEIRRGLHVEDPTAMRNELVHCDGFDILVDCYKSNPQSLAEALETMQLLAGYPQKIAILGDMLELGPDEERLHYEAGLAMRPDEIDYLLFIGDLAKEMERGALVHFPRSRVFHFNSKPDLVDRAKTLIDKSTLVLVKASRAMRLEEVVESIRKTTV